MSLRSKITQTINLILHQIALTTIFDDNHQLWPKSSSLIFSVESFRETRQTFFTLSIFDKDTYFLTHTSALCRVRWFVRQEKYHRKSPPPNRCFMEFFKVNFFRGIFSLFLCTEGLTLYRKKPPSMLIRLHALHLLDFLLFRVVSEDDRCIWHTMKPRGVIETNVHCSYWKPKQPTMIHCSPKWAT